MSPDGSIERDRALLGDLPGAVLHRERRLRVHGIYATCPSSRSAPTSSEMVSPVRRERLRYITALMLHLADAASNLAILLAASLIQGFFGFGFGIVAMSGLTLTQDLVHAAGVVNITGILSISWITFQIRRHILRRLALRMLPPLLVGILVGVTALRHIERDLMVSILGASVLAISVWNLARPRLRSSESPRLDGLVALLGGLLGGAFNTGGPPLIIHVYRRPEKPEALKATILCLFLAMGLARLPIAAAQGLVDESVWADAALAAPAVVGGAALGMALARRIHPDRFRRACWICLGLLGIGLLVGA
jgi:hypothetical protein